MAAILTLLPEGFEEIEAITPIDLWRRAGLTVTTAALADGIHVTGKNGITIHANTPLSAVPVEAAFDALFLPGGPGVKHLRADPRVRERVLAQVAAGGWVLAICAAPTVLADAGVLAGRHYTAHFSVAGELPELDATARVVVDGRVITSRGAGTAQDFALETIRQLLGAAEAEKVAVAISA
jgi:protein deglycase